MLIHRDEAMAECLAAKQPVGEYRSDALAAEEILTLANWCLLNYSGLKRQSGVHHEYPDPVVAYPAGQRTAYWALSRLSSSRRVGFQRDARLFWMITARIFIPLEHPRWQRIRAEHKTCIRISAPRVRVRWTRSVILFKHAGY